jgi:hypothetical protein
MDFLPEVGEKVGPWQPAQPGLSIGNFQITVELLVMWQSMQRTLDMCGVNAGVMCA